MNKIPKIPKRKFPKCSFCGIQLSSYGKNSSPLITGRCCEECFEKYVLETRIAEKWVKPNELLKNDLIEGFLDNQKGKFRVSKVHEIVPDGVVEVKTIFNKIERSLFFPPKKKVYLIERKV